MVKLSLLDCCLNRDIFIKKRDLYSVSYTKIYSLFLLNNENLMLSY